MLKVLSPEQYKFLRNEITRWEEQSLLNIGQGGRIASQYAKGSFAPNAVSLVGKLGALLLGLGMVTFVSTNWTSVSLVIKMGALTLCGLLSYFAGWRLTRKDSLNPLGESFVFLGCLLFGCLMLQTAQYFHLGGEPSPELVLWGLGIAPVACFMRSAWCGALVSSIFVYQLFLSNQSAIWQNALGLTVALIVSYYVRNNWSLAILLGGIVVKALACQHAGGTILLAIAFFAMHLHHKEFLRLSSLAKAYLLVGMSAQLGGLISLTSQWTLDCAIKGLGMWWLIFYVTATLCLQTFVILSIRNSRWALAGCGLLTVGTLLLWLFPSIALLPQFLFLLDVGFMLMYAITTQEGMLPTIIPLVALFFFGVSMNLQSAFGSSNTGSVSQIFVVAGLTLTMLSLLGQRSLSKSAQAQLPTLSHPPTDNANRGIAYD